MMMLMIKNHNSWVIIVEWQWSSDDGQLTIVGQYQSIDNNQVLIVMWWWSDDRG